MEIKSKNILNSLITELGSAAGNVDPTTLPAAQQLWREFFNSLFLSEEYYKLYSYLLEVTASEKGHWSDGEDRIIPIFKNTDIPPQYRGGSLYNLLTSCNDAGQFLSSDKDTQLSLEVPNYGDNIYVNSNVVCVQSFSDFTYLPYVGWDTKTPVQRSITLSYTGSLNLWDEQFGYNPQGSLGSANYISVIPSQSYYATAPNVTGGCVFYDSDKVRIGATETAFANQVFTAPANAAYMTFSVGAGYGTTYKNDICINYNVTEFNGTYEAYRAKIDKVVKSVSRGMICIVCDTDDEAEATAVSIKNAFDGALALKVWLPASMDNSYLLVPDNSNAILIGKQSVPFDSSTLVVTTRPVLDTYYSVTLTKNGEWTVTGFPGSGTSTTIAEGQPLSFMLREGTVTASHYIKVSTENCTVTAKVNDTPVSLNNPFEVGTVVTLTATANTGYVWSEWVYTNTNMRENGTNVKTITIGSSDIYLKAVCIAKEATVTVTAMFGGTGTGYFTMDGTAVYSGIFKVSPGKEHTLVAVPSAGLSDFGGWTSGNLPAGQDAGNPTLTFTPTADVKYVCKFVKKGTSDQITIQPMIATQDQEYVTLYITKDGKETALDSKNIVPTVYNKGEAGSIRAVCASGYRFISWGDHVTAKNPYAFNASDDVALAINSDYIDIGVTANTYTIKFNSIPTGVTIKDTINGVTFASGTAVTYESGTHVYIQVTLGAEQSWVGWSTHTTQTQNFDIAQLTENYEDTPNVTTTMYNIDLYTPESGVLFSFDGVTWGVTRQSFAANTTTYVYAKASPSFEGTDPRWIDLTYTETSSGIWRGGPITVTDAATYTFKSKVEETDDWLTSIVNEFGDPYTMKEGGIFNVYVTEHLSKCLLKFNTTSDVLSSAISVTEIEPAIGRDGKPATEIVSADSDYLWWANNIGYFDVVNNIKGSYKITAEGKSKEYYIVLTVSVEINQFMVEINGEGAEMYQTTRESLVPLSIYTDDGCSDTSVEYDSTGGDKTAHFWLCDGSCDLTGNGMSWQYWVPYARSKVPVTEGGPYIKESYCRPPIIGYYGYKEYDYQHGLDRSVVTEGDKKYRDPTYVRYFVESQMITDTTDNWLSLGSWSSVVLDDKQVTVPYTLAANSSGHKRFGVIYLTRNVYHWNVHDTSTGDPEVVATYISKYIVVQNG